MGKLVRIVTPLHKKTSRDYLARMTDDKIYCAKIAKKYGRDYWDGDRRYGYGGNYYDGRWKPVAIKLINKYHLTNSSKILDVGCGKAFLIFEIKKILPGIQVTGMDISKWGISHAPKEVRSNIILHRAEEEYPFSDKEFDLVISLTTLHNLPIDKLKVALNEIERVGKRKYLVVESYRNISELFNLECWALTCEAFFSKKEWEWIYQHFGYTGDYEFIYFE